MRRPKTSSQKTLISPFNGIASSIAYQNRGAYGRQSEPRGGSATGVRTVPRQYLQQTTCNQRGVNREVIFALNYFTSQLQTGVSAARQHVPEALHISHQIGIFVVARSRAKRLEAACIQQDLRFQVSMIQRVLLLQLEDHFVIKPE